MSSLRSLPIPFLKLGIQEVNSLDSYGLLAKVIHFLIASVIHFPPSSVI